ncbi:hypothetical protein [Streptomyces fradiae]|uniref:hypothetical protein n=1 Tax=Streptomyces fradiae TaxID=1906 RepID=UPI0036671403
MTALQTAAARLTTGTQHLTRRLGERATAWVRAGRRDDLEGWRAALGCIVRAALLAGGLWLLWRTVRAAPALMLLLVPAGLLAAWRAGHPHKAGETLAPAPPADTPAPTGEGPAAGLTVDQIRTLLHTAFGTDDQAHITALADRLTEATGRAWTAADIRAAAEAAGARVERGVRMPGRSPSTGIRRHTLPAPSPTPPPGPVAGVVVAGQEPATRAATATATPPPTATPEDQERGFRIVQDETNPHRHRVVPAASSPR